MRLRFFAFFSFLSFLRRRRRLSSLESESDDDGAAGGGGGEAPAAAAEGGGNALGASIAKHSENSYYYAHGATHEVKVRTAPRKLETSARREVPITEVREFGFSEDQGGERICV